MRQGARRSRLVSRCPRQLGRVEGPGCAEKTYPLDVWYHIAQAYDGKTSASYVDGELQTQADIALLPQGEGRTSVSVRINLVDYFKGAVQLARFTRHALTPTEFLRPL